MNALSASQSATHLNGLNAAIRDHGVQSMKFVYDQPNKRIVSDDPNTWIEYCGMTRDRGLAFVLVMDGKRIGFREPDIEKERIRTARNDELVWTIGNIGTPVICWDDDSQQDVEVVSNCKFSSRIEQNRAVDLIKQAMRVFYRLEVFRNIENISVHITPALQQKLESGVLIDD